MGVWLFLFLGLLPVSLVAGDALTQSLEQPNERGTVLEKVEPSPSPPPPVPTPTLTDREANEKIHIDGKPSRPARRRARRRAPPK